MPPTTRSKSKAIRDTAQAVETSVEATARRLLLRWDDLPPWRRDNPSIHSGYRPESGSFLASLGSLLYLHNESVNIWTHLIGAAAVALGVTWAYGFLDEIIGPRYATASSADAFVFACFFAGAFCCLGMSGTYHMLSNHSEGVAKWGNKLDYTGIVFLIVGSYVPALWYGFFCWAGWLTAYLGAIALLGLGCLVVSWFEHFRTPAWRPYRALMFVGLGLSGVIPVLHGLSFYGYRELDERMGLSWVLLQGALYISGAFLYAVRFPECKWPGAFDIWGSSHQIFHVCVLLAATSHLYGMIKAFDHHHGILGAQC
ncbi:hemolysin-III related-domain-containing protein [Corynascus novoguineensis]|uniref:Hemolysin-III related-domain-containing protein n=1 Tax=Corynascus novoguineensis TaxID=1126955 RepID=A0AAN7CW05_9PEZI|nr:hemolysin-III related-domain-containing protein [Corynascus novoguineensis]